MSKISDRNILQLIAEKIGDSVTWCRFSQVNKVCKAITERLLVHEVHDLKFWYAHEYRTRLPCGILHGEVKGYKRYRYYNEISECDLKYDEFKHRWWYSKCYRNGKLHGYYTVGSTMVEFKNGKQSEHQFMEQYQPHKVPLGYFESAFWKNRVNLPNYVNFREFEEFTQL